MPIRPITKEPSVSDHDKKFFDNFLLIIGVMVFVTLMLFLLAQSMSEDTQEQWTKQDPAFKAATEARLKPAGYAVKTGDAEPVAAAAVAAVEVEQAPRSGADVFNEACAACHVAGVAGAPRLGDTAAWTDRIAKGRDTLVEHAIKGFAGSAGYMPAKGGRMDLSDADTAAAVEYMMEKGQ
jgi:cytochrome c5